MTTTSPEPEKLPRFSHAFAWSVVFLRNGGERIRAVMITVTWFNIGLKEAREWVDSVQIKRIPIDKSEARKTAEEYPHDFDGKELEDTWTYDVSHWPAWNTRTRDAARVEAEARLLWLEQALLNMPDVEIFYADDDSTEDSIGMIPMGWSIRCDSTCVEPLAINAPTFNEAIDLARAALAKDSNQ